MAKLTIRNLEAEGEFEASALSQLIDAVFSAAFSLPAEATEATEATEDTEGTEEEKDRDWRSVYRAGDDLPDDLAEACESMKLAIVRHKLAGWTEASPLSIKGMLQTLLDQVDADGTK